MALYTVAMKNTFTPVQIKQARLVIGRAMQSLGALTVGQVRDLLLDNFDWLKDCQHADELRRVAMRPTSSTRDYRPRQERETGMFMAD